MRYLALVGLLCVGCSQTNISDLMKELANDPNANCIQVNAGPYGSILVARGTPKANVRMGPGQCDIIGSDVTTIQVPTNSVTVQPK